MAVQLAPETQALIQEELDRGAYASADEFVRAAVQLMQARQRQIEALRAAVQVGRDQLDRGEGVLWTPELHEQIRQSAGERVRRGERPGPDVVP